MTRRRSSFSKRRSGRDRKSTRLNSSHTVIYTLSLHDALPIFAATLGFCSSMPAFGLEPASKNDPAKIEFFEKKIRPRSEEHTSELQSHSDLHSFPTRRSSDLRRHARFLLVDACVWSRTGLQE